MAEARASARPLRAREESEPGSLGQSAQGLSNVVVVIAILVLAIAGAVGIGGAIFGAQGAVDRSLHVANLCLIAIGVSNLLVRAAVALSTPRPPAGAH